MPGTPTSVSDRLTPAWPASAGATLTTLSAAGMSNGGMSSRVALTCTEGSVVNRSGAAFGAGGGCAASDCVASPAHSSAASG